VPYSEMVKSCPVGTLQFLRLGLLKVDEAGSEHGALMSKRIENHEDAITLRSIQNICPSVRRGFGWKNVPTRLDYLSTSGRDLQAKRKGDCSLPVQGWFNHRIFILAMTGFYDRAADAMRYVFDKRIHTPATLEADRYFPEAELFAQSWHGIRDEAVTISKGLSSVPRFHELMEAQTAISANDGHDWRVFVMRAYGYDVERNLARCPITASLVERCPSVLSASFSFLAPGKHIPPHRGPFRGILRFHLGLSMPDGDDGRLGAVLWVNDEEYRLPNGGTLLWDDTYPHEVLNATDQVRICLLLDVWRSEMPADMVALSHVIVGAARFAASLNSQSFTR
jgi:aspartate beta-hydroxylase